MTTKFDELMDDGLIDGREAGKEKIYTYTYNEVSVYEFENGKEKKFEEFNVGSAMGRKLPIFAFFFSFLFAMVCGF